MFHAASAFHIGRDHVQKGQPCQDRAATICSKDGSFAGAVLCDGAGSCARSEQGAERLCLWFRDWLPQVQETFWQLGPESLRRRLAAEITLQLEMRSAELSCSARDLSSTFLAVAVRRKEDYVEYRFVHLGDGIVAAIGGDGTVRLSSPDNGEFANETVFTSSPRLPTALRVDAGRLPLGSGFAIMSDGAGASLYLKASRSLAPAIPEMIGWLNDHDEAAVSPALHDALGQQLCAKTGDDCSIAIILDRDPACRFVVDWEPPKPPTPPPPPVTPVEAAKPVAPESSHEPRPSAPPSKKQEFIPVGLRASPIREMVATLRLSFSDLEAAKELCEWRKLSSKGLYKVQQQCRLEHLLEARAEMPPRHWRFSVIIHKASGAGWLFMETNGDICMPPLAFESDQAPAAVAEAWIGFLRDAPLSDWLVDTAAFTNRRPDLFPKPHLLDALRTMLPNFGDRASAWEAGIYREDISDGAFFLRPKPKKGRSTKAGSLDL